MSFLDWITDRQRRGSPVRGELKRVMERVDTLTSKVNIYDMKQIQASSFSSIEQRDAAVPRQPSIIEHALLHERLGRNRGINET